MERHAESLRLGPGCSRPRRGHCQGGAGRGDVGRWDGRGGAAPGTGELCCPLAPRCRYGPGFLSLPPMPEAELQGEHPDALCESSPSVLQ